MKCGGGDCLSVCTVLLNTQTALLQTACCCRASPTFVLVGHFKIQWKAWDIFLLIFWKGQIRFMTPKKSPPP